MIYSVGGVEKTIVSKNLIDFVGGTTDDSPIIFRKNGKTVYLDEPKSNATKAATFDVDLDVGFDDIAFFSGEASPSNDFDGILFWDRCWILARYRYCIGIQQKGG